MNQTVSRHDKLLKTNECKIEQRWEKVLAYEMDDPSFAPSFSKGLASEVDWDFEFTLVAIGEYKKFMLLSSIYPESMVPSIHVDTVWHWHLLFTKSYQKFCRQALGQDFLHHQPGSGKEEDDNLYREMYADTLAKYEEFFGTPPQSIWGKSS